MEKENSVSRPRILLADDHRILMDALTLGLQENFDVLGTYPSGRELLQALERHPADAVVLDISMPEMNGLEAARRLSETRPGLPIVFLTMHLERPYVEEAFRAGGMGYVVKRQAASDLVEAIRSVLRGERYVSASAWQPPAVLESKKEVLTPRQRELLQLVSEGKSGKEIAAALCISLKTVEFHKAKLMDRLGLRTTAELTRYAVDHLMTGA